MRKYEGTRLGRQELNAELLEDVPGALWTRAILEQALADNAPDLRRIVVAVDPAVTTGEESNETCIIVAAVGSDGRGYTLQDGTISGTPAEWGARAVALFDQWRADRIIVEANQGGDMVEHVVRTAAKSLADHGKRPNPHIAVKQVRASRGKLTRAEPVAALYEQGRVKHVGIFPQLEDQMCEWVPGETSPDRMDALVWAYTELMLDEPGAVEYAPNVWG